LLHRVHVGHRLGLLGFRLIHEFLLVHQGLHVVSTIRDDVLHHVVHSHARRRTHPVSHTGGETVVHTCRGGHPVHAGVLHLDGTLLLDLLGHRVAVLLVGHLDLRVRHRWHAAWHLLVASRGLLHCCGGRLIGLNIRWRGCWSGVRGGCSGFGLRVLLLGLEGSGKDLVVDEVLGLEECLELLLEELALF